MTPKEFFDKVVEMRRCQKEYFKNKRQIDLHVHLDGSVSIPMAKRLALINGIELNESEEDLKERLQVSKDCRDLNEYLEKFEFPLTLLQKAEALSLIHI